MTQLSIDLKQKILRIEQPLTGSEATLFFICGDTIELYTGIVDESGFSLENFG